MVVQENKTLHEIVGKENVEMYKVLRNLFEFDFGQYVVVEQNVSDAFNGMPDIEEVKHFLLNEKANAFKGVNSGYIPKEWLD